MLLELKKSIDIRRVLLDGTKVSASQMKYFAFGVNGKYKRIYKIFTIDKKSGSKRVICDPTPLLKIIQRRILEKILNPYIESHDKNYVTGFTKNKSIKDNAIFHINKKVILKIDLKDFFPSISTERIFILFRKMLRYNYQTSKYLAGLCTYRNQIPQGSPTSPALSNIVSQKMDIRLYGYLKSVESSTNIGIEYSRYADDITISFNKNIGNFIEKILNTITEIIEDEGFEINYKKLQILGAKNKQKVTGIVVNDKLSIGRENYRFLRLLIHVITKYGFDEGIKKRNEHEKKKKNNKYSLINAVNGKILFLNMINSNLANKLNNIRSHIDKE